LRTAESQEEDERMKHEDEGEKKVYVYAEQRSIIHTEKSD